MEFRKDGYCGLYCGACLIFIKTENGTIDLLAAEMNMSPEELSCYGCKSEKNSPWCATCALKTCARERKFEFCIDCDEYVCEDLRSFIDDPQYPYHLVVERNMERISEEGLEKWLATQEQRWRCPACGQKHAWKDEQCKECGADVSSYLADLK